MLETKTKYTPTEVLSKVSGLHRKKLYQMMENGEITYEFEAGEKKKGRLIDASELVRVFGTRFTLPETLETSTPVSEKQVETLETPEIHFRNRLLEQEVKHLNERLGDKNREVQYLNRELNDWKEQAQKLLLTYQPPQNGPTMPVEASEAGQSREASEEGTKSAERIDLTLYALFFIIGVFLTALMYTYQVEIKTLIDSVLMATEPPKEERAIPEEPVEPSPFPS